MNIFDTIIILYANFIYQERTLIEIFYKTIFKNFKNSKKWFLDV